MRQQHRQALRVVVLLGVILLAAVFAVMSSRDARESTAETTTVSEVEIHPTALAPTPATPVPLATAAIDLWSQAARPAFPDVEVVHVVQVAEPYPVTALAPRSDEVQSIETWIDQTNGHAVVSLRNRDGDLRQLSVKQRLTAKDYRTDANDLSSLHVTTMLSEDDPNLLDPTEYLYRFRSILAGGEPEIEQRGGEVMINTSFDGRPAVKLVMPVRDESGEVLETRTVFLDPQTLFPLAMLGSEGRGRTFSYPIIETLDRADVPAETFDPQIPEAQFTYLRERLSLEVSTQFREYPIWWLGESFSGYTLQFIERVQTITLLDSMTDNDTVLAFYLTDPTSYQEQFQIFSEPRLSDSKWAHVDAAHNVHGFQQLEIRGERAWLQPGQGYIEIDFADSWVALSAPTDELALAVAQALQPLNRTGADAGH